MAEFPALPLWTDAYLADTRHLSTLEHGAYLLLLMEAWRRPNTSLPDDDSKLAKLAGLLASEWHDIKPTIMALWRYDNRTKTWSQKRLTDEKSYVSKNSKKQRSNAKARWEKEKDLSHGNANHDATQMPNASQTDAPTPTPTPTPTSVVADDVFKRLDQALNSMSELDGHPLKANPNISPIFKLVQEGFDIQTEIIPVIRSVLIKARPKSLQSWAYFVDRIREGRTTPPKTTGQQLPSVDDAKWKERLMYGRANKSWFIAGWGPMPNSPGCQVPLSLVQPTDGQGWSEHKAAS